MRTLLVIALGLALAFAHVHDESEDSYELEQSLDFEEEDFSKNREFEEDVDKVRTDINTVLSKLSSANLPVATKHLARENLKAMSKTANRLTTASGETRTKLEEALKLRTKALHMQLEGNEGDSMDEDSAHAVQDNENDLDDEMETPKATNKASSKLLDDVKAIKRSLEAEHLSFSDKTAARDNLRHLEEDAVKIQHAPPAMQKKLKEAMRDRVEALRMQTHHDKPQQAHTVAHKPLARKSLEAHTLAHKSSIHRSFEEHSAPKVAKMERRMEAENKVEGDLDQLVAAVKSSSMPSATKVETLSNIAAIRMDVQKIAKKDNPKLKEAIKDRMKALHLELEEHDTPAPAKLSSRSFSKPATHHPRAAASVAMSKSSSQKAAKSAKASKVVEDVRALKSKVKTAHLPRAKLHEVEENLAKLEQDAQEISRNPSEARAAKLRKAMHLRVDALKDELH